MMEKMNLKNQTFNEFINENFTILRKKGEYSPVYFVAKTDSKYDGVYAVKDAETDTYKREVKSLSSKEYSEVMINPEFLESCASEFTNVLFEYFSNNGISTK